MPRTLDQELYKFIVDRTTSVRYNNSAYDLPTWDNLKAKGRRLGYSNKVVVASLMSLQQRGAIARTFNPKRRRYEFTALRV
jgi:hypothetical protein